MNKYKLVCCGNFMNHYINALSKELQNDFLDYHYIVSDELPGERKKMGFSDLNELDYVIKAYENKELARKEILSADIVITGSYKYMNHIDERIKKGKPTFFDSERLFKYNPLLNKVSAIKNYLEYYNYKNALLLCISAYACGDYNKAQLFKNRTYKWGYFPEPFYYNNLDEILKNKKSNSIIWAGRLIDWKHPEYVIEVAKRLKEEGYSFEANIIGNGEMEDDLKNQIQNNNLSDCVHMLGSMPPDKVRKYMEESEIYLFTSDRGEGWGVVLNEAMNSLCATVCSYSTGSTPFVVKDKENGLVYKNDDVNKLYEKTKYLLDHKNESMQIAKNGYITITKEWSPKQASNRLATFVEAYLNNKDFESLYTDGILSKALPIE